MTSNSAEFRGVCRRFERNDNCARSATISLLPAPRAERAAPEAQLIAELFGAFVGAQRKRDRVGDVEISGLPLFQAGVALGR